MGHPTRTQAIKTYLEAKTWPDLAAMYNHDMEVQVNVAQEGGERTEGEYRGKQWLAWTDGINVWKSFRIPYKANTEPEYVDRPMSFDLGKYVEGIGMTGWDWKNRVSRWFAYDFDALTGHSDRHAKKLTDTELGDIREVVKQVPWVSLRTSTSGKGLHLYVSLINPAPSANHHEHAAIARAILSMLTAATTFDFNRKVDICGGNMWVWHRKMYDRDSGERVGLKVIKTGEPLQTVPPNWKDHLNVVRGRSMKTRPSFVQGTLPSGEATIKEDLFNELTGQRSKVELDSEHKALLDYLQKSGAFHWWDADHWMLVTHTYHLKQAHNILNLRVDTMILSPLEKTAVRTTIALLTRFLEEPGLFGDIHLEQKRPILGSRTDQVGPSVSLTVNWTSAPLVKSPAELSILRADSILIQLIGCSKH
jgi:hypothetical protein